MSGYICSVTGNCEKEESLRVGASFSFGKAFLSKKRFLCYTPEEFEDKRKEISIVRQAIKEGVVI